MTFAFRHILLAGIPLCLAIPTAAAQPAGNVSECTAPRGFRTEPDGTLVHEATGARFPVSIAGFTRTGQDGYDPSGEYVTVEYHYPLEGASLAARISLVHVEQMSAAEHYVIMKPLARQYFTNIEPLSEGPLPVPDLPEDAVWSGTFSGTREGAPYLFSLTTVNYGYWSARIATAAPEAAEAVARQKLTALITALKAAR